MTEQGVRRTRKLALVALVTAGLLVAHRLGILEQFADPARVKQTLLELGPWGYLAFVAAYAVLQPFGVPGTVFIMAAPLIWSWPVAFALSMTGTMAASVVGFSFARFVARDWIAAKIPARFRKYDEALERRALLTVFLLRLVFWMPPLLHAFFGVSKVGFRTHFWGSLLGYTLPLLLVSYFGQDLFDSLRAAPGMWLGLSAGVLAAAATIWLLLRCRARRLAHGAA